MNNISELTQYFTNSTFFIVKRDEFVSPEIQSIISKLLISPSTEKYHPKRKNEYLLGRYCAYKAVQIFNGTELLSLNSNDDRTPNWPPDLIGSISHSNEYVCAAIADKTKVRCLGLDIELLGRTKIELARHILTANDLKEHTHFSAEELLTFIFSAKESLYKALYPEVKKFFGFDYAYVSEIDFKNQTFKIFLTKSLNSEFGPQNRNSFEGRFALFEGSLLTILEIV